MKIEPPSAVSPRSYSKPASAVCCHALAFLSLIAAAGLLVAALAGGAGLHGAYVALGCFAIAVLWWALGDIVVAVDRSAPKP